MAAASMVRVLMAPPALRRPPPRSAEGAEGGEPEPVSPSRAHQGTRFNGGQVPTRARQSHCKGKGHWKSECPKQGKRRSESENLGKIKSKEANCRTFWLILERHNP